MPSPRFEFLDHPGPIPFAHRGGAKEAPENTWASFSHARSLGYRYLETDVHATADGVVVAIHDPSLDRVADRTGLVGELRWAEVAAARVAGTEAVPRLEDLLAEWPDARWNIDAKHDAVVEPLVDLLRRHDAVGRVCVISFSDARISRVRRALGPELCTGGGPRQLLALRAASLVPCGGRLSRCWQGAAAAQVPVSWRLVPTADRSFVDFAHRQAIDVHVWTVDDEASMERLVDIGVDGIMTDRPGLLRSVLERRGLWAG